jgi:hypothetical protein
MEDTGIKESKLDRDRRYRREYYYRNKGKCISSVVDYKENRAIRKCSVCFEEKTADQFHKTRSRCGKKYFCSMCKKCESIRDLETSRRNGIYEEALDRKRRLNSISRTNPAHRAYWIVTNCKSWDIKHGFGDPHISEQSVIDMIINGCKYCGDSSPLMMGLDRIDNSLGHTIDNVVPCCRRCNYIRGAMPIMAWDFISAYVKKAYDDGLFGGWQPGPKKNAII